MRGDRFFGTIIPEWVIRAGPKHDLYSTDTDFIESYEDLTTAVGQAAPSWLRDHTILVLKPDAIVGRRVTATFEWLEEAGFDIVLARAIHFDRHTIRALWLYQWNIATRARKELVDQLLTSCGSLLLLVRTESNPSFSAAEMLSTRKGPSSPERQRTGDLRHRLGGISPLLNFVHTADAPADVVREFGILL
ncbi:MAG: nucleoside-diphosphate kinase, partial [Blastocatellia bacterium]